MSFQCSLMSNYGGLFLVYGATYNGSAHQASRSRCGRRSPHSPSPRTTPRRAGMGTKAVPRPCAQALRGGEGPPESAAAWQLGPRPRDAPPHVLAHCRIVMARRIVELATHCLRSVGARPRREAWPRRRRSSTHSRRSRGRGMLRGRGLSRCTSSWWRRKGY